VIFHSYVNVYQRVKGFIDLEELKLVILLGAFMVIW
jgi:hypothetical protein